MLFISAQLRFCGFKLHGDYDLLLDLIPYQFVLVIFVQDTHFLAEETEQKAKHERH